MMMDGVGFGICSTILDEMANENRLLEQPQNILAPGSLLSVRPIFSAALVICSMLNVHGEQAQSLA
jgi:hypothetical protein